MSTISYERRRPSTEVVDEARRFADQVRQQKAAGGLRQLTRAAVLSDGTIIYVADLDYTRSIHIVPAIPVDEASGDAFVQSDRIRTDVEAIERVRIAGVLSGGMTARFIERRVIEVAGQELEFDFLKDDEFQLMPETRMPQQAASHKLAIPENERLIFSDFSPLQPSQYRRIYPSNYTGAMAAVVQVMLGVGRPIEPDQEDYWMQDSQAEPLENPDELLSQFFDAAAYLQVDYDWRWARTHGVVWGQDEHAYLVQIGSDGVYVTLFPTDAFSRTSDARQRYEQVYPWLAQYGEFPGGRLFMDAFGGFPSGVSLPNEPATLQRMVRAGLVWHDADAVAEFYECNAFSSDWGWAFDDQYAKAINTCWKIVEGRKFSYAYQVQLDITRPPAYVNPRANELVQKFNLLDPIDLYKARRLDEIETSTLLAVGTYEDFDAVFAPPPFEVQLDVVVLREGCIDYAGGAQCPPPPDQCQPSYAPHFKYYEPLLNAVVTFDFTYREPEPGVILPAIDADGPLHACYVGSQVNILHFYFDLSAQSADTVIENTRQDCQFVGQWEQNNYTQSSRERGFFYCDAYDWRRKYTEGAGERRTYTGHIAGTADYLGVCDFFGMGLWQTRSVFGFETYEGRKWTNSIAAVAIQCPSNDRQMFFACEESIEYGVQNVEGRSGRLDLGTTGYSVYGFVADSVWHWRVCGEPFRPCGDPPFCEYRECGVDYTDSCLQSYGRPEPITYRACPDGPGGKYNIVNPCGDGGVTLPGCWYTPLPSLPPAFHSETAVVMEYKCKLRAFGHPLAHNLVYKEHSEAVSSGEVLSGDIASRTWFMCALPPHCMVPQWRTLRNCFGTLYVAFAEDYTQGWVERGNTPPVTGRMFFGAVDDQLG